MELNRITFPSCCWAIDVSKAFLLFSVDSKLLILRASVNIYGESNKISCRQLHLSLLQMCQFVIKYLGLYSICILNYVTFNHQANQIDQITKSAFDEPIIPKPVLFAIVFSFNPFHPLK